MNKNTKHQNEMDSVCNLWQDTDFINEVFYTIVGGLITAGFAVYGFITLIIWAVDRIGR